MASNSPTYSPDYAPASPPESSLDVELTYVISSDGVREGWEEWDMRILILYILFTQLYLHLLGRRRKSRTRMLIDLNVWFIYLFADVLATIALGKLSKIKGDVEPSRRMRSSCMIEVGLRPRSLLRSLWAPIILFYLGGPDTIIALKLEENEMWLRHLIGLLTQGLRTSYVLYVTRTYSMFFVLALLMLFSGIIKYGERVWIMKSRAHYDKNEGYVPSDESTIKGLDQIKNIGRSRPEAKLVLQAYYFFQTLKPHIPNYACDRSKLTRDFREWIRRDTAFKLIEIELGFMYDAVFSKIGMVFSVWGCILRFICFSCTACVFVGYFFVDKPYGFGGMVDVVITIILLLGALFLEVAGTLEQLVSDWAVVWGFNHPSKLATPFFCRQELVISKRKRWSESMGQFDFRNFCNKYKLPTKFNKMMETLCGREKMLKKFCSPLSEVQPSLKELIINRLYETSESFSDSSVKKGEQNPESVLVEVETLQTSIVKRGERTPKSVPEVETLQTPTPESVLEVETLQTPKLNRGEWTLEKYGFNDFNWSIESIVIWHIATDICYHLEKPNVDKDEVETSKILSYYMMYLVRICPSRLPICKRDDKFLQACADDVRKLFEENGSLSSDDEACKLLLEKHSDSNTVKRVQQLARVLMEKENRWKIMSNVWVEMLLHAAINCPEKNHVQELRHGGEFLTHVWLLLLHLGVTNDKLERNKSQGSFQKLRENVESEIPSSIETLASTWDRE